MKRRTFLTLSVSSFLSLLGGTAVWSKTPKAVKLSSKDTVTRLAFGSCAQQDIPQPIWGTIAEAKPDVFVFIGDNIYGDTEDMNELAAKYRKLGSKPEYIEFCSRIPVLATWDDHDYGINDGGAEYPKKEESKKLMLDFFREPEGSERRSRPGIYTSYYFGSPGRRLQLVLLDLRWFRTPLNYDKAKDVYLPSDDPNATMLGAEQWKWLEAELKKPADVRIIASSIQFGAIDHRWEKWANYPLDKKRMMNLIDKLAAKNVVFISGDMHYGELSSEKTPGNFTVYDVTSSGMNFVEPGANLPNGHRMKIHDTTPNFGVVEIDWTKSPVMVTLQVRTDKGQTVITQDVAITPAPAHAGPRTTA